jgi:hypothetical protein
MYLAQGKTKAAILPYQQAMTILRKTEGTKGLAESIDLFQKGIIARALPLLFRLPLGLNDDQSVEDCLRKSLDLARKSLHPQHVFVALVLHELAFTLMEHHKDEEAEGYFRECLTIARGYGLDHPKTTFVLANFGTLLSRRGKQAEAEQLLAEALEARRKRYPADHYLIGEVLVLQAAFLDNLSISQRQQLLREALTKGGQSAGGLNRWTVFAVRRMTERLSPSELCDIADELALAAAAHGEKNGERNGYQDLALSALRSARQKGFQDVERLQHDKDLDNLRGRPDFQKLLAELQAASGP